MAHKTGWAIPFLRGFANSPWTNSAGLGLARIPACHGTVNKRLLARNEYLAAENRILKARLEGRLKLSDAERATLGEGGTVAAVRSICQSAA